MDTPQQSSLPWETKTSAVVRLSVLLPDWISSLTSKSYSALASTTNFGELAHWAVLMSSRGGVRKAVQLTHCHPVHKNDTHKSR